MNKHLFRLFCCLAVTMSCCQSDDSSENLLKGLVAIETKDYYDAISYLTLSINQKPNSDAYYNRALVFSYLGDSCKFCDDLKQAVNMSNEEDSLEIDFFEFKNVYNKYCTFKSIIHDIPDTLKLKHPNIVWFEVTYQKCGNDSTINVVSKNEDFTWSDELLKLEDEPVFQIVEIMPEFAGGERKREKFFNDNIRYPEIPQSKKVEITVYVSFIVEKDGSISTVKFLWGIGGSFRKEAIRVASIMPKWKPGKQNGKPVRVQVNMPIKFTLYG